MILINNVTINNSLDNSELRNHFSVFDFNNLELFAKISLIMKSPNKIKNIENVDFSDIVLSKNGLSNRAVAQIKRRLKDYQNNKKNYQFKSNYIKYLLTNLIPPSIDNSNLKKYTLPLIASFIVTDGCINIRKNKEFNVLEMGLGNKNIELIYAFNDLIFLTYNEIPSSIDYSSDFKRTRFVASWHKSMIEEIRNYCYKNNNKSIKNLLKSNKKISIECLRIAMSCDGFVTFYISRDKYGFKRKEYYNRIRTSVELGCKPLELRQDWKRITDKLGLNFHIKEDRIKSIHYRSLKAFLDFGGFIPETLIGKNSKYFENIDKNRVLETLVVIKRNKSGNVISNKKEKRLLINRVIAKLK